MALLDEILVKIKISTIIGKDVKLKLNGHEYLGCCPFHKEKSPSFRVNDAKGLYYCFGCQEKGNAFTYLERTMSKQEALETLAKMAGVKLSDRPRTNPALKTLTHLYRAATDFFKTQLNRKVSDYLKNRGINDASIQKYELGFCPEGDSLYTALAADFPKTLLDESELFMGSRCRFRGRLMFPIKNIRGDVIAFGGRILESDQALPNIQQNAKYINSKETSLFKKGETLYGLFEAAKKKKFLIVEGYLDVIKVAQQGDFSAVGPLGTTFSKEQADHIWSFDEMPYVCFDGDAAGRKATFRLIEKMVPFITAHKSFAFLDLPEKEDADSYASELAKLDPISCVDKLFTYISFGKDISIPEHHALIKEQITKITEAQEKQIGASYRQYLFKKLWDATRGKKIKSQKNKPLELPSRAFHVEILSKVLLATLINHPILLEDVQECLGRLQFNDERLENLKAQLLESYFTSASIEVVEFLNFEQLEAYAPFIKVSTPIELVKESWMEVLHQYTKQNQFRSDSWDMVRHLKADLIIGDNNG